MKFYFEMVSGEIPVLPDGLNNVLVDASYRYRPNPKETREDVQPAWQISIDNIGELLALADAFGLPVMVAWKKDYPPAEPREHIPVLSVLDAEY